MAKSFKSEKSNIFIEQLAQELYNAMYENDVNTKPSIFDETGELQQFRKQARYLLKKFHIRRKETSIH